MPDTVNAQSDSRRQLMWAPNHRPSEDFCRATLPAGYRIRAVSVRLRILGPGTPNSSFQCETRRGAALLLPSSAPSCFPGLCFLCFVLPFAISPASAFWVSLFPRPLLSVFRISPCPLLSIFRVSPHPLLSVFRFSPSSAFCFSRFSPHHLVSFVS